MPPCRGFCQFPTQPVQTKTEIWRILKMRQGPFARASSAVPYRGTSLIRNVLAPPPAGVCTRVRGIRGVPAAGRTSGRVVYISVLSD